MSKRESQKTGGTRRSWGHWGLEDGRSPWHSWESADRTGDGGQRRMLNTELCPVFSPCSEFKCVSPKYSSTGLGGIFYYLKVYSVCFGEFCFQVELRRYRVRTHAHLCVRALIQTCTHTSHTYPSSPHVLYPLSASSARVLHPPQLRDLFWHITTS